MNPKLTATESSAKRPIHGPWTKPNGKPKRPLSAYNLYFQVERARILKNGMRREDPLVYLPEEVLRMSNWHKVRPRRPHRKSHGRVSFQGMARIISDRWKDLDQHNREVFMDQAKLEKAEYVRRVKDWEAKREQQEQDAAPLELPSMPADARSSSTLPHANEQTSMNHRATKETNAEDVEGELELGDLVSFLAATPPDVLSFETSASSFDSLESYESLNLMNEELFEVEISAEFHVEMEIAQLVGDNFPSHSPDCASTDVSSSSSALETQTVNPQNQLCVVENELAVMFGQQNFLCEPKQALHILPPSCVSNDERTIGADEALSDLLDDEELIHVLLSNN